MTDIDPSAYAKRLADLAKGGKGSFGDSLAGAGGTTAPGTPVGNEVLAWLAGNRLRIRDSKDEMRPRPRGESDRAGALMPDERPDDPIDAANTRSSVLSDLRRDAPDDPRVVSVFEADPIVAEDPSTATVVTSRMLRARGRPVRCRAHHARAARSDPRGAELDGRASHQRFHGIE